MDKHFLTNNQSGRLSMMRESYRKKKNVNLYNDLRALRAKENLSLGEAIDKLWTTPDPGGKECYVNRMLL